MVEAKDFSTYLAALRERERGEGLPAEWVSDSHFWLVDKDRIPRVQPAPPSANPGASV